MHRIQQKGITIAVLFRNVLILMLFCLFWISSQAQVTKLKDILDVNTVLNRIAADNFGYSVAISGDIVVVGAYGQDYDTLGRGAAISAGGAAYIFYKNNGGANNWGLVKKITGGTSINARKSGDNFGFSVAISGDVIVIGAYGQDYDSAGGNLVSAAGAAYIYNKNSGGTDNWGLVKKITPQGTNARLASDNFGYSVAINGDEVVVGAHLQDYDSAGSNMLTGAGAAYIFSKNSGGTNNWGLVKKITGGNGTNARLANDNFGNSVAISGDVIVVGAKGQDYDSAGLSLLSTAGAAYIFGKNSGGTNNWGLVKKITPRGTNARRSGDNFGQSVAIDGDVIIVGAHGQDFDSAGANNKSAAGAAYLFYQNSGGTNNWGLVKKITGGTGTNARIAGDNFGFSVSISGDAVVVGAYQQDYDSTGANLLSAAGAAYIFTKNNGGTNNWGLVKKITPRGTNARITTDNFGNVVAISGDLIVAGARGQDFDSSGGKNLSAAGAGYLFAKNSGGTDNWGLVKKLTGGIGIFGRVSGDRFGYSVAIDGDVIVVGAYGQDYDSLGWGSAISAAGAAYIFYKNKGGIDNWGLVKKITPNGLNARIASDNFGFSVSISGDVVAVGAFGQDYDSAGANLISAAGAAYIFYKNSGGTDNWGLVKKITPNGSNVRVASDNFGYSLAISGDVLVVGSYLQDYDSAGANLLSAAGAAYIFSKNSGGTDNWGLVKKVTGGTGTNARLANDNFGNAVAISGDIIVVGARGQDYDSIGASLLSAAGAAYIFEKNNGGTNNWGLVKKITPRGTNARRSSDNFGFSVAINGDVIVVGANGQDYDSIGGSNKSAAGAAYIFNKNSGGTNNWGLVKKLTGGTGTNARLASDNFGYSVAISGSAIIVGAYAQDYDSAGGNFLSAAGAAYTFLRNNGGTDNWGLAKKITGGTGTNARLSNAQFGNSVAIYRDVAVVGAQQQGYDSTGSYLESNAGRATIFNLELDLYYTGGEWWPYAPSSSTGGKSAYVLDGIPSLPLGAVVNNLSISNIAAPSINDGMFTVLGSFTNHGAITGVGKITLGGSIPQNIFGAGTTNNLELDNPSGATINDYLIITGVYTHEAGALTTNGKLILAATSGNIYGQIAGVGSGTITGDVTAQYFVLSGNEGWRPISSPLNGATLAQITDDLPLNFGTPNWQFATVYTFNESRTPSWQVPLSNTSMDDSCFSLYMGPASWAGGLPAYLDITGTYGGTADYTINNLSYTGSNTDTSGWHYMRNPWPSAFIWDGTIGNIQGNQVYLYDQNNGLGGFYRVYDATNQGSIPPFAALLFQVTSHNASVTLPNNKRTTDSLKNVFDKSFPLNNYVEIGIKKEGQPITDFVKFYTDNKALNNFDAQDGIKKLNDPSMPSMYFNTGMNKLNKNVYNAIQPGTTKIPMLFQTTTNGTYLLYPRIENLEPGIEVFIEDLEANSLVPLFNQPIQINYTGGGVPKRYNLVFVKKLTNSISQTQENIEAIKIAVTDNVLNINANLPANTQVTLTDILGRVILQQTISEAANGISQINLPQLATGYYIVTLSGNAIHYSQKIIIK